MGKTDLLAQHLVDHATQYRARLRHKPNAAGIRHAMNESSVEPVVQVHQSHAVGADHAHAITMNDLQAARF